MRTLTTCLVVAALGLPAVSLAADPCSGAKTTIEINECLGKRLDEADARLNEYLAAAGKHIESTGGASLNLKTAQEAWVRYRDAQCNDVYKLWEGGTARTAMGLQCRINLTQERTHDVWRAFLTFMDSTPPLKPEPEAVHDRE